MLSAHENKSSFVSVSSQGDQSRTSHLTNNSSAIHKSRSFVGASSGPIDGTQQPFPSKVTAKPLPQEKASRDGYTKFACTRTYLIIGLTCICMCVTVAVLLGVVIGLQLVKGGGSPQEAAVVPPTPAPPRGVNLTTPLPTPNPTTPPSDNMQTVVPLPINLPTWAVETNHPAQGAITLTRNGSAFAVQGSETTFVFELENDDWVAAREPPSVTPGSSGTSEPRSFSLSGSGEVLALGWKRIVQVFVFNKTGGVWEKRGADIQLDTPLRRFSTSLVLSHDGNRLVVGRPREGGPSNEGYVRLYEHVASQDLWNNTWGTPLGRFANTIWPIVDLSANFDVLVLGELGNSGVEANLRVYSWQATTAEFQQEENRQVTLGSVAAEDSLSLSVSSDGQVYGVCPNDGVCQTYVGPNGGDVASWESNGERIYFSKDSDLMAVGSWADRAANDWSVQLYELIPTATTQRNWTKLGFAIQTNGLSTFSVSGRRLALANTTGYVHIYDFF